MNPEMAKQPLLSVKNLRVHFRFKAGLLQQGQTVLKAVDDVSFYLAPGETLGIVGESGCGKTTLGKAVVQLTRPTSGSIEFEGEDLARLDKRELRRQRRGFQMIFQDPYGSLNPRFTAGECVGEALDIHGLVPDKTARRERVRELLAGVGLDPAMGSRYPHQFSGGQRQRIGIARALAVEPKLLVCDEPVSALDVSVQAQVVNLLQDLQEERGIALLFISHDLAVVEHISHRVMVMYLGKIVELASAAEVTSAPQHPYTQALLSAVPMVDTAFRRKRIVLCGEVPSPIHPPGGCPFHTRCPVAQFPRCAQEVPSLREVAPNHWASCHFA